MTWTLHRHDARRVSEIIAPESVDLIVTSPPYFALRSYRDECEACGGDGQARRGVEAKPPPRAGTTGGPSQLRGGATRIDAIHAAASDPRTVVAPGQCPACNGTGRAHYDGQLGSEATPGEFVDNLIACTADWLKVLKPTGSLFVNLGDKFANDSKWGGASNAKQSASDEPTAIGYRQRKRTGIPAKSRIGAPWRYAIRCIDELGLILRADIIWSKVNGLPESVQDRVRISHEYLFHFVKSPRYFAAIDEIREGYTRTLEGGRPNGQLGRDGHGTGHVLGREADPHSGLGGESNPLGKAPSSVWAIPSEPLQVPDHLGVDHFAAYPSELVRRCVLGWTPSGWCTACGEARRPVVDRAYDTEGRTTNGPQSLERRHESPGREVRAVQTATITGYVCACPTTDAPTTPAVVADFFCGTGTTVAVAHHLGRHGVGADLSSDYLRLAEWRVTSDERLRAKVLDRSGILRPREPDLPGQISLFSDGAA